MEKKDFKKLLAIVLDDHVVIDDKIKRAIENERRDARNLLIISLITLAITGIFIIALKYYSIK